MEACAHTYVFGIIGIKYVPYLQPASTFTLSTCITECAFIGFYSNLNKIQWLNKDYFGLYGAAVFPQKIQWFERTSA